jgi:outer membrane protein W
VQRFAPYFGGGVGAYTTTFHTRSEALGCAQNCSDTGPRVDARSRDIGVHALAGADYYITAKYVVAGEIRYLRLKADFGAIGLGKIDAGGAFLWAGFRRHF